MSAGAVTTAANPLETVASFLRAEFPGADVGFARDAASIVRGTVLFDVHAARTHLVLEISEEVLGGVEEEEIRTRLRDLNVAGTLIAHPREIVRLGRGGATLRPRWW